MKLGRLLLPLLLLSPTGCSFFGYAVHNIVSAPIDAIQECAFRHRIRNMARADWQAIACADSRRYSSVYERGFEDGFVDYVDANGTGEPPAMPPTWLRRGFLHSDQGSSDIEEWYAGFRHGSHVAQEKGLRERAVMPIGLPARTPNEPLPAQVVVPIPMQEAPAQSAPFPVKKADADPPEPMPAKELEVGNLPLNSVKQVEPASAPPIPVLEESEIRVPLSVPTPVKEAESAPAPPAPVQPPGKQPEPAREPPIPVKEAEPTRSPPATDGGLIRVPPFLMKEGEPARLAPVPLRQNEAARVPPSTGNDGEPTRVPPFPVPTVSGSRVLPAPPSVTPQEPARSDSLPPWPR